jgi:LysM repeat protein
VGRFRLVTAKSWARRRALPGGAAGSRWARYLAPAVFLLAVTGIVLAIRAGLSSDEAPATTTPVTTRSAPAARRPKPASAKRYYVIRSGDTLGAIAARLGTTVAVLLRLNPDVEPTALRPGEQIRVE